MMTVDNIILVVIGAGCAYYLIRKGLHLMKGESGCSSCSGCPSAKSCGSRQLPKRPNA